MLLIKKGTHMKTATLLLASITLIFSTFSAEKVSFRDGTFLQADIYTKKGFEPNADGVILIVMDKLYFHHYPPTKGSLATPPRYFYHGLNPYGISSCVPSRISFFHFETFALVGIREKISYMNIPAKKKAEAIKGIDKAMSENPPKEMTNPKNISKYYSKEWEDEVLLRTGFHHKRGRILYGQDYELLKSFKKKNLMNKSRALAKKRR